MLRKRVFPCALLAFLFVCLPVLAHAQAFTNIVVFGDSLSDTGNDTLVSGSKYGPTAAVPSPTTGYTTGRFTDGLDTLPGARLYTGVWIEQLAAMLPAKPTVSYSLNPVGGGRNYAYGFATTNTGQSTFTYPAPNNALSFQVNNMGQQVADYLATNPTIDNKTLFVVWGGANDLIAASTSANPAQDIQAAAQRDAAIVQMLIARGATDIIVPNLPPLGLVPRFNGSAAVSAPATQAAQGFDQVLALALAAVSKAAGANVHIYPLDTYTLFNTIVMAPANQGFANVTLPSSAAFSTANVAVNPDTYLFWDDLHPTTHGHNLIALAAMALLGTPTATTTTLTSSNLNANLNASVTFTATVATNGPTPTGTVTFADGTTTLGSSVVTGTGAQATATFTTSSLSAGTHTITATFTGVNGSGNSTSNSVTEVVTAPSISTSFGPSGPIALGRGASTTVPLNITPVGGIKGTATFACAPVPMFFTCTVNPSSLTLAGDNKAVSTTVTISTTTTSSLRPNGLRGDAERIVLAFALPCFGLLGFGAARRRGKRSLRSLALSAMLLALLGAGVAGMTGCGDSVHGVRNGQYTVAVTTTVNGTTSQASIQVNVQ